MGRRGGDEPFELVPHVVWCGSHREIYGQYVKW